METAEQIKARIEELEAELSYHKAQSDTLKISVNGSFGKLGNKYSLLYSPQLLIQVTLTGQLALLMLIERFIENGVEVISANTDGVVLYYTKDKDSLVKEIAFEWMLDTSFELERTDYKLLASRDVNNYIAIKTNNSIKNKGVFAKSSLSKNPDAPIVFTAVEKLLSDDIPVKETIISSEDITDFLKLRNVTGGAVYNDEHLGRAVRFYYSTQVPKDSYIKYHKNGNKVPLSEGAKPLMILPDRFPTDVDYERYIQMSNDILKEINYDERKPS